MSRSRLFSDRHVLGRGVREMVSSLFHRRRSAPMLRNGRRGAGLTRRSRRKSVADRVRGWLGGAVASGQASSGTLTLRSPEPSLGVPEALEARLLLAVTANSTSTVDTLAVWMTADNDQTYVRQVGDATGARLQISSKSDFSSIDVYNGAVPANLYVYDGANISVSSTPASGGSGYTTAPAVTVSNTTFAQPLAITSTIKATGTGTFAGTGLTPSSTYFLFGSAGGASALTLQVTTDASGSITGTTITGSGGGFTNLAASALSWSASGGAKVGTLTGSLTGAVDSFRGTLSGTGYYRQPQVTVATQGGATATATLTIDTTTTWTNTGFTSIGATPLASSLNIGAFYYVGGAQDNGGSSNTSNASAIMGISHRYDGVETVVLKAGSINAVGAIMASTIDLQGNIAAPTRNVELSTTGAVLGTVNIGANISSQSLSIRSGGAGLVDVVITGGIVTSGSMSIDGGNTIVVGSPLTAGTTFYGVAKNNFTVSSPISTGATVNSWALLQSTTGTLKFDAPVTSAQGALTLQATTFAGAGLITGRSLTIEEGGGAGNYTLNANVTNLAGNTASNLTLKNAGGLTIGQGALSLTGAANTLSLESTGGNINVAANIVMSGAAAGIVSLKANNGVTISGTILPQGQPLDLTVAANTGAIAATSALQLGTGNLIASAGTGITIPNLTAGKINVTTSSGNLTVTETDGVNVEGATVTGTGNLTITTLSGDIKVLTDATVGIIGSGGTATLQSNNGGIDVNGSLTTTSSGTFVINAANGLVTNGANGSLATGTLNWIATSGVQSLLNTAAVSRFSKLAANITGSGQALQVATGSDLELTNIVTKSGEITVDVNNASSRANLSITGSVTAGNTLADSNRMNITLSAVNGSITSTGSVTGNVLSLTALNSSTLQNQNILQLNASITAPGENLSVTATSGLKTGDISASDGNVTLKVTSGNLTRSGNISAGATSGTVNLSVDAGKIIGTSTITTDTLRFSSTAMPDLTKATFAKIGATLTSSGDLSISRSGDLTVEAANASFGNVNITLTTGNLTINGAMNANGPSNITLQVDKGSISTAAGSPLTANILNVTSQNDIVLNTNVTTLIAKVTGASGNITIVEANGLTVGAGNVQAANDISLTATAGDIVRTGQVNSTGSGNVTLNASAGAISGSGVVKAGNLSWTSKAAADINGTSGLSFTNLSASVTGAGNALTITGTSTSNVNILAANTSGGALSIIAGAGKSILLEGPVTAGAGTVTLTAAGGKITSNTTDRVTGSQLTVTAGNDVALNTAVTGLSANVINVGQQLVIDEADGLTVLSGGIVSLGNITLAVGTTAAGGLTSLAGSTINSGDSVNIVANALGFGGAVSLAGVVTATKTLSVFANGTSSVNTDAANITANVVGGGLTIVEDDGFDIPTSINAAGPISITSTSGNITGAGAINAGSGNAVTLTASLGNVTLTTAANAVTGSTLTITAQNDSAVKSNVTTLVATIASGGLTVTEATDLVVGAGVTAVGDITLNLANGNLSGAGGLNAGTANVAINAAAGGVAVTGKIVANALKIDSAAGAVSVTTNVTTLTVNATGFGNGITVAQTGDLTIGAADIVANDADIKITATGNIGGAAGSKINAGVGNVTLTSTTGNVTLNGAANQVTGNVLTLSAVTASKLETNITSLLATLTGDLESLTVNQSVGLDISGVTTNNALFDLNVATGDLGGTGVINTGTTGNATLNVSAGKVDLAGVANQVVGNVLTVKSKNSVELTTKIVGLTVNISNTGDGLTVVEANGLNIAAGAVQTKDGDVSITAGSIGGTGAIQVGTGAISLTATTGAITLNSQASQVKGGDLTLSAGAASALETAVANVAATVAGGGLTINEADALAIDTGDITAAGDISITAAGAVTGANAIDAGANIVTLKAAGAVTLNSTADQVKAGTLNVTTTAAGSVDLTTNVATLVASVTTGDLTVSESSALAIGAGNVTADGKIAILLTDDGSLTGTGKINATGAVNLTLAGTGDLKLGSVANQVTGTTLTIAVTTGTVNVSTKADNLNASASGAVTVVEASGLTVDSIETTDANVNVTLTAGDLTIANNGIQAGQVGNVTLGVGNGAITSTGGAKVFANVLTLTANSSSLINTAITTLSAKVTGALQSLTIHEEDDAADLTPDGLTIGSVVTSAGDVTLNVSTGNLGGAGVINTLNVTSAGRGNVTLNVPTGSASLTTANQIVANELAVSVYRSSSLNTNVTALNQVAALSSLLGVANVATISAAAATDVVTATGHTFVNGDRVQLRALAGGTGLANDTNYFVINADTTNGTLQLANTVGGAAVNITTDYTGGSIHATQLLTITEVDDLQIEGQISAANDADITISVGGDLLQGTGKIDSTSGNVTLTALTGSVGDKVAALDVAAASGLLTVTARDNSFLDSAVESLAANVTAGALDVNQTGNLEIAAGNVRATGGVVIKVDDAVSGNISGNGTVTAVSNNVTLNVVNGAVLLNAVNGQIVGNVLNLVAKNDSFANTAVASLTANITGATQNLTIVETNGLAIDAGAGVKTSGGDVSIKLTQGSLTGTQVVNAGAGDVALNVLVGGVNLTGQVTADLLDVRSVQAANLGSTNVTNLSANIAASGLTVTELNDLNIELTNGVRAFSGVTLNVGNGTTKGNLAGSGVINGGASTVSLNVINGSVTLNAAAGQIVASTLNLTAQNTSVVNTAVGSLVASISDIDDSLEVNELDSLSIGAGNVVTNGGDVTINAGNATTSGNLSIIGQINTSGATPGNVVLTVNGALTGVGSIVANSVDLTAVNSSALNVNVTEVKASVSRDGQSLTIASTKALSIAGGDVTTSNGSIAVSTAAGDLTIASGVLDAGAANVTLSSAGGITATAGNVAGNVLSVTAADAVSITTAVTSLSANVTGSTKSLTVVEEDSLTIGTGGLRTVNGKIDVQVAAGGLAMANPVNAGTANVVLNVVDGGIAGTAAGLVTGQCLTVNVAGDSSLFSNVTEIVGTTSSGLLSINAANGVKVATGNLTATGTGGLNLVAVNGAINLVGGIVAGGGAVTLTTLRGDVTGANSIAAATSNVTINANGSVALASKADQVTSNVLTVVSSGNVAINTGIDGLTATLNGTGRTLSIVDSGDFKVRGTGVSTSNANITLSAATGINLAAPVSAGNRTISLVSSGGGFTGLGAVSATNLTLNAAADSTVVTTVTNLAANLTAGNLVVNQTGSLTVRSVANTAGTTMNGVKTASGSLTLNVSGGSLNGTGAVNAGTGNVVLNAATGAITLNSAAGQIVGDVVTLRAQSSSAVSLAADTLEANVTGTSQALTVADTNALELANVSTAGGLLAISLALGDLNGTGLVNVGAGNVTLNVAGAVDLDATVSQITANDLSIKAGGDVAVNTSVGTFSANVTGAATTLSVTEFNGLALTTGDVVAGGDVTVTVSAGSLTGTRAVTSKTGDVTLAANAGSVTLTSRTGQVAGGLLNVTALSGASVNTNVANLTATVTGGSLTISQTKTLNVATAGGINTSAGGGNVTLTILSGDLGRDDGAINAGTGNVTLNVSRGNVTLNAAANLVTASVLNVVSRGDAAINTAVATIGNAAITSTGSLTITEADDLTITRATAARNNVNVNAAAGTLTVTNITASVGTVNFAGSGNVNVGAPGITAGTLNLSGVNVSVSGGGNLSARTVVSQTNPVNWLITAAPTGAGSLGSVLNQVNNFNGNSLINVTTPTNLTLQAALPQIRQSLTLEGNGQLTLNRGSVASTAAGLTIANPGASTTVVINGVTLRDFGTGIDLRAGSKSTVTNVTVLNSTTGLQAAGSLTGSTVTQSTFDGQNRASSTGAVLSSAVGLTLGENTSSFNTFRNVRDGLSATGTSTNTKVFGNRFEAFARYGLSLVGVRGIEIGENGNLSRRNTIGAANAAAFGVFASGTSTGSSVNDMLFESSFQGTKYRVSQSSGLTINPPIS